MRKKIFIVILILVGIGSLFVIQRQLSCASGLAPQKKEKPAKGGSASGGKEAPDFTLPALEGGQVSLSELKGKVVLLNFFALGCEACQMQIPELVELNNKYKEKDLVILGVVLDRVSKKIMKDFLNELGVNYTVILANYKVVRDYGGMEYIPTTFVIDKEGNIDKMYIGYVYKSILESKIKELLE